VLFTPAHAEGDLVDLRFAGEAGSSAEEPQDRGRADGLDARG
jgi:hypothetical protein